jgi:hypothetical protein
MTKPPVIRKNVTHRDNCSPSVDDPATLDGVAEVLDENALFGRLLLEGGGGLLALGQAHLRHRLARQVHRLQPGLEKTQFKKKTSSVVFCVFFLFIFVFFCFFFVFFCFFVLFSVSRILLGASRL